MENVKLERDASDAMDFQAWQPHRCTQALLSVMELPAPMLLQNSVLGTYAWAVPGKSSCRGKQLTSDSGESIWQALIPPSPAGP